ncbi:hypothetical protein B0A49_01978 [Cryomyces minteri]|uniref:Palmitoyltransferase n=1 Tax=Cryomyces minteri TaxID=331657 RepID=A0A4U0XIK9_9PEZI|nr:hypothetical protein B0A49_01978 [Cryomyces minteri]
MATLASPSPSRSPSRRRGGYLRKCERYCCTVLTYFPLAFVYGLTSWAVWVEAGIGLLPVKSAWTGYTSSALGILLYILLNWSYTTAVFTDPGSPLNSKTGYSSLPIDEQHAYTSFTVKSTGEIRYCKKCQMQKPDRAHHCSTCRRCVLKMDHHCPWLATCVGLRNYKPFLLFLMYTCLFCWLCFAVSFTWVWTEIVSDGQFQETMMPVNYILLAVLAGIIGLVLTGFTGWHIWLACRGQTTIENLEKTRYLSPIHQSMRDQLKDRNYVGQGTPNYSQQLREIHANALPGVTRPEEGEERSSPAADSLRRTYNELERERERDRYQDYLDEQDSEKLPNAFDLGWRRNLRHVFGENRAYWWLPICNTTGDGWQWDPNPKWLAARDDVARERQTQEGRWGATAGRHRPPSHSPSPTISRSRTPAMHDSHSDGRNPPYRTAQSNGPALSLQTLDRRKSITNANACSNPDADADLYDTSSDEDPSAQQRRQPSNDNWNDIPDDFLPASRLKQR